MKAKLVMAALAPVKDKNVRFIQFKSYSPVLTKIIFEGVSTHRVWSKARVKKYRQEATKRATVRIPVTEMRRRATPVGELLFMDTRKLLSTLATKPVLLLLLRFWM